MKKQQHQEAEKQKQQHEAMKKQQHQEAEKQKLKQKNQQETAAQKLQQEALKKQQQTIVPIPRERLSTTRSFNKNGL
jgi:hypothetical protein